MSTFSTDLGTDASLKVLSFRIGVLLFQHYKMLPTQRSECRSEMMKVIDLEQVYLGYAVHLPTGKPATDQYTEIEMGAAEREKGGEVRCDKRQ